MKRSPIKRKSPLRKKGETVADALWREARLFVMERDGWQCQGPTRGLPGLCDGTIEVHHIRRRSQGGGDEPANLITLCRKCHSYVHGHPAEAYELGLLTRSGRSVA